MSDHLGIGIDIDISTFFNGPYSTLESPPGHILTLNNVQEKMIIHQTHHKRNGSTQVMVQSESYTNRHDQTLSHQNTNV